MASLISFRAYQCLALTAYHTYAKKSIINSAVVLSLRAQRSSPVLDRVAIARDDEI
ncbi:hypothetical protein FWD20_02555 [Candidatus Saccharibacteria bacterium]|nr:hypothetical protein [Candidatus Saccharibacteria bacterium]